MGKRTLLLALTALGCAGMSEAQRCRIAASFQTDATLREVELNRCELVAIRESNEQMHSEDVAERQREQEETRAAAPPPTPAPAAQRAPACIANEDALLFPTEESVRTMHDASKAGVSDEDFTRLGRKLGVRAVNEGTKCRVTGTSSIRPFYPVVLLEGDLVGESGWMVLDQAPEAPGVVHAAPY